MQCPSCNQQDKGFTAFRTALLHEEITLDNKGDSISSEFGEYIETYPITLIMCDAPGCGHTWEPEGE